MFKSLLTASALGGVLLLAAGAAHANPMIPGLGDTVHVATDGHSSETAKINFVGLPGGPSLDVYSGPETLGGTFGSAATPFSGLVAYCTDLYNYFTVPSDFTVGHLTSSHQPSGTNDLSAAQVNNIASLIAADHSDQSATQLAIWSVDYGTAFSFSKATSTVTADVTSYLGALNGMAPANFELYQLQAAGNQGMAYGDPVPEPASMALLGVGLAGLGVIRRRQRA